MSITKLKAGLLSAAVVVGAGTSAVVQHQTVSRLREENEVLREQTAQVQQLRAENQQVAGLRADGDELEQLRKDVAELHRLRAEVAQLRREKEDAARLQAENTRLKESVQALAAREAQSQAALMNMSDKVLQKAQYNAIVNNLRIIEGAKEQWALENKKGIGDTVTETDLLPYLKDNVMPSKVVGETYVLDLFGKLAYAITPVTLGAIAAGGKVTAAFPELQ
jgi:hypothetical protein